MNRAPRHISAADFAHAAREARSPLPSPYFAMYSSYLGGVVTDPALMLVPVDDHLVHRGDGVFETMKCADGWLYNPGPHLDRLQRSAAAIGLRVPATQEELLELIEATIRAGTEKTCTIRVLVSRGPGSLGVNPYDSPGPQLYIVTATPPTPQVAFSDGARACFSHMPVKPGFLATVKSCNYLPNVLMKKEAVDAGVDFVLALDEAGGLAEGPTESVAIVSRDGAWLMPEADRVLTGTTALRIATLAGELVREGLLSRVAHEHISQSAVVAAAEIHIIGTTPDLLPVVELEGRPVGDGRPGPVAEELAARLQTDMAPGSASLHRVDMGSA